MSGPTLADWLFGNRTTTTSPVRPAGPLREIAGGGDRAGRGALASECQRVADAQPGERDHVLNVAAFRMGQLIAGGHLEQATVIAELTEAGLACGQSPGEVARALRTDSTGGLARGGAEPRRLEPREAGPGPLTSWTPPTALAGQEGAVVGEGAERNEFDEPTPEEFEAAVRQAFPRLDWSAVWDGRTEEDWIVEPLISARRLVALYSAPKAGKSLVALELAAAVSCGREVLGCRLKRARPVLYVDFENDPEGDVVPRLKAMGFAPDQLGGLSYLSFPSMAALDTARGGQELLAAAKAYGAELVVIDTVSRAISGEENANDTWLSFYRSTGALLKAAGIACIRLDHSGKDVERGMRGASAKYSDVDAVWRLTEVGKDALRLECTDARFLIDEKDLVVRRERNPLLHRVDPEGGFGIYRDKLRATVATLDELRVPNDASNRAAREALIDANFPVKTTVLAAAVKIRQARLEEPEEGEES